MKEERTIDRNQVFPLHVDFSKNDTDINKIKIMTVQELINTLIQIEDKSIEVRLLSADHSNDAIGGISIKEDIVYLLGE